MKTEEIVIRRFNSRQDYLDLFNGFTATLWNIFEGELASLITKHAPGISTNTARQMSDAIRDDRFNRLFDEILPYDVEFIITGVEPVWRDGKLCHILSIDDYMSEVHGGERDYSELHDLNDCRDDSISWSDVEGQFEELDALDQALLAEVWWIDHARHQQNRYERNPTALKPSPAARELVREIIRLYSGKQGSSYRPHRDQYDLPFGR